MGSESGLLLKGGSKISWGEYGIPDPSILISKVEPTLDLKFDLNLEKGL